MEGPKIKRLYYSTKEISSLLGISPQILRSWEKRFSFLRPTKSKSGRRQYKPADVEIVKEIQRLKNSGLEDDIISRTIMNNKYRTTSDREKIIERTERQVPVRDIIDELKEIIRILDSRDL